MLFPRIKTTMSFESTDRACVACTNDDVSVRTKISFNEILCAHEQRSDLLLRRTRARTSQDVMTSISSAKEEKKDEHLEMDIDLSIRSQRSKKEEKEDEHPEMDIDLSIKGVVSRGIHEEEIAKVDEGLLPPMYNVEG